MGAVKCKKCSTGHWRGEQCLACAESRTQRIPSHGKPITAMVPHGFHALRTQTGSEVVA